MSEAQFADLVVEALEALPPAIRSWLENVEVLVEDWPTRRQLADVGVGSRLGLLGLYEGVPQTARGGHYGMVLPDRVTVFRRPILAMCRGEDEVRQQVARTVAHELAHHFGIDDDRLRELGAY